MKKHTKPNQKINIRTVESSEKNDNSATNQYIQIRKQRLLNEQLIALKQQRKSPMYENRLIKEGSLKQKVTMMSGHRDYMKKPETTRWRPSPADPNVLKEYNDKMDRLIIKTMQTLS